jgi:hypothetical protein
LTWILCLTISVVDENTDYSRDGDMDRLVPPAADTLFGWTREGAVAPEHCVPSLLAAIPELKRLN